MRRVDRSPRTRTSPAPPTLAADQGPLVVGAVPYWDEEEARTTLDLFTAIRSGWPRRGRTRSPRTAPSQLQPDLNTAGEQALYAHLHDLGIKVIPTVANTTAGSVGPGDGLEPSSRTRIARCPCSIDHFPHPVERPRRHPNRLRRPDPRDRSSFSDIRDRIRPGDPPDRQGPVRHGARQRRRRRIRRPEQIPGLCRHRQGGRPGLPDGVRLALEHRTEWPDRSVRLG